jgi:archaellum component FlaF (FlaF/FlaG flagellin family)
MRNSPLKNLLNAKVTRTGYKRNSPDVNNDINIIPSGDITMEDVDFKVKGTDNKGNTIVMEPGKNYKFPGDYVVETRVDDESV